ncbi:MAG TPA: MaoC family dehydratase N-terminal domain-containing protein [Candidatus Dormibacteraeota bacterium]
MSTTAPVIDRLRSRIGLDAPSVTAAVEAGHVKRFAEAIGDPNPRWAKEAPPTFLVALAPVSLHLAEAEEYGKGWLNGGNRFEYFAPVMIGDNITATGRVADVYEKPGSTGTLLFIVFETDYVNQRGELVARLRGTAIRR